MEWDAEYVLGALVCLLFLGREEGVRGGEWDCWLMICGQFIDRRKGFGGLYGGQVFPPGELRRGEMILSFEKTVYGV